jgi:hypothetical protein
MIAIMSNEYAKYYAESAVLKMWLFTVQFQDELRKRRLKKKIEVLES